MHVLRIGGEFDGGVVVAINREGVLTRKGEYTRFYTIRSVEVILSRQQQALAA